ncbi:SHOCT domain-containing protein [Bacillus weihaiensis]|uniref:SHOCT domain-containing protein n=1 Tax=Bacillus weihaiensis TaxID=1547283 RepID=A0A1L3MQP6_9BACI|nr:SHOCT domain-containing protein [Bacillus weihaiensis]APH04661.1 hypothetical protein A9C19_07825 [Bacillus weihaiensis]
MAERAYKEFLFKKSSKTTVYLYQSTIEIIHHGLVTKFDQTRIIPYKHIEEIQMKKPGVTSKGVLVIRTQNQEDLKKNTIVFSKNERELAIELKEVIEGKIVDVKELRANFAVDNFEKLKKLKELHDLDILTEDEYLDQKERILEGS